MSVNETKLNVEQIRSQYEEKLPTDLDRLKALDADRVLQDACQFQICRKLEKDLGWRIRGRAEESGDYVSY